MDRDHKDINERVLLQIIVHFTFLFIKKIYVSHFPQSIPQSTQTMLKDHHD